MSHSHDLPLDHGAVNKRLWATVALNILITVAEFVAGLLSGSLALLSDAAHNLSDVVAIVLALVARHVGRRPATPRHTYGLKRVEVVAALVNAVTLVAVVVLIAREAFERLLHPQPVSQGIMLVVGLIALVANVASVLLLRRHDRDDVNVRGAYLHMAQDALASVAVVVAALFATTPAGPYVDAGVALLVGIVVLRSALSLAWQTLSTILEGVPDGVDVLELAEDIAKNLTPASLHHVHVWQLGPGQRLLTAHVTVGCEASGLETEHLLSRIKERLHERWEINHATLEPEIEGCGRTEVLGLWEHEDADEHGKTADLAEKRPRRLAVGKARH